LSDSSASLSEGDWDFLVKRIRDGKCTPFLGAGASQPSISLAKDMAVALAKKYEYPFEISENDLAKVTLFMAIKQGDPIWPKEQLLSEFFHNVNPPDFNNPTQLLRVLAELPLPVYMTTNYDSFMMQALQSVRMSDGEKKKPRRELCKWNDVKWESIWDKERGYRPTEAEPVVYHFHGMDEVPESLVLTEDDYISFLVNTSRDPDLLPPFMEASITSCSLLFLGYSLSDVTFQVIFRGLISSMDSGLRRLSLAVQLPPEADESTRKGAQDYLNSYYSKQNVRVYWGTAEQFGKDLYERLHKTPMSKPGNP
jgi:hypothetical protein